MNLMEVLKLYQEAIYLLIFEMDEDGKIENKYIKNTIKCNLKKGGVIIRDKRTWHRGTKNDSAKVRYMVSTSYCMN